MTEEKKGKRKLSILEKFAIIIIVIIIIIILMLVFNRQLQQYYEAFKAWYTNA
jgi:uncharacterized membrane protein YvbJ